MKENPKDFFRSRVYMLPFSAFKLKDNKKCMKPNYYVLLSNMEEYYGFSKVLDEFQSIGVHKIDKNIKGILDSLELPIELKTFYRVIVLLGYLCLICNKDFDTSYDILTQRGYFSIMVKSFIQDVRGLSLEYREYLKRRLLEVNTKLMDILSVTENVIIRGIDKFQSIKTSTIEEYIISVVDYLKESI